jgi:AcrR family transcriptional regulator
VRSDDRNRGKGAAAKPVHGRSPQRRRGRVLEEAIRAAVLEELAEHNFDEMSIERVAERAKTGKAAIYRRWPTKLDLIIDTLVQAFPDPGPAASSGDLRTDLIEFHRNTAEALTGPLGAALRANVGQHRQHPELAAALQERILAPRHRILHDLLAAGVERGEVRASALTPECIDAGPTLIRQRFIETGQPVDEATVTQIVDNVLIPMLRT